LLRQAGVAKYVRAGADQISIREAERRTGVSRQTLSVWMRELEEGERRRYDALSLDLVANGLKIDRRELGIAALKDSGHVVESDDQAGELIDWLAQRTSDEKRQALAWLLQEVARQDAEQRQSDDALDD